MLEVLDTDLKLLLLQIMIIMYGNVDTRPLMKIGTCYNREAGVKNLKKELASICHHLLRQFIMVWKIYRSILVFPFEVEWDLLMVLHTWEVPKDRPGSGADASASAGPAITMTLSSLLTKTPVPSDSALTGEMTLHGKILVLI